MRVLSGLILVTLVAGLPISTQGTSDRKRPSHAQQPPPTQDPPHGEQQLVDALLVRVLGTEERETYELKADFIGSLTLVFRGSELSAVAAGTYHESRKAGEARRRKIAIKRLDLPLLLRPFSGALREAIERKADFQTDNPANFRAHDIFILEAQGSNRYVLSGVHRAIVDDALDRYGQAAAKEDPAIRRHIARWLYTSPVMHDWVVRPGPPYALRTLIDQGGLVYELTLFYNWGQVGTKVSYVVVNGQPLWREIITDTVTDLSGVGRVDGQMTLTFSNHCLNCHTQ